MGIKEKRTENREEEVGKRKKEEVKKRLAEKQ
jgi:hypothetical protein